MTLEHRTDDEGGTEMPAICRKCLRTAQLDAAHCGACGGIIDRFDLDLDGVDTEEVEGERQKVTAGGALPPLFADLGDF